MGIISVTHTRNENGGKELSFQKFADCLYNFFLDNDETYDHLVPNDSKDAKDEFFTEKAKRYLGEL
jgi:hypothetical protein